MSKRNPSMHDIKLLNQRIDKIEQKLERKADKIPNEESYDEIVARIEAKLKESEREA